MDPDGTNYKKMNITKRFCQLLIKQNNIYMQNPGSNSSPEALTDF